jgi:hypothetical protein
MSDALANFRRFAALIAPQLASAPTTLTPTAENAGSVQVERGVVFAHSMNDPANLSPQIVERLIESADQRVQIIDRHGHTRHVYRPLLIYCWLQTFSRAYEKLHRSEFGRWEEALRTWCDLLERSLGEFNWPGDAMPASLGSPASEIAWTALTLHRAGKIFIRDAWTDLAADTFGRFTKRQQLSGAFLATTNSDNPETSWYHELVLLHAAASYAVQSEDRALASGVLRATDFHAANTQPDHATNQPWALFAFIWNEKTRPLAEQVLHASATQDPATNDITLMLLADALYCLRLFLPASENA